MTVGQAINTIDELRPNQYSPELKMRWLSMLDGKIFNEVIKTHLGAKIYAFTPYEDMDRELLVEMPYDYEVYINWLQAQIDWANAEIGKYNQSIGMYNASYVQWMNEYNRTHKPISGRRFRW